MSSVLDLSDNEIEDIKLVDLLEQMPNLKVLYLKGNPVVGNIKMYRRTLVSRLVVNPLLPYYYYSTIPCHTCHIIIIIHVMHL
jgi:hypothetical protein